MSTRLKSLHWLANTLSLLAGFWFLLQAWMFAHMQDSMLDEGAYLLKGVWFVTGRYTPYQSYGPWTNHMPLSYLIPGSIQVLFGPGLKTGRFFMLFIAALMLVGFWILARRIGGAWGAAVILWVWAINPLNAKTYGMAVSQGLVACMLIWTLVLVLGEKRTLFQIVFGAILAGLILMTRINMLFVLPLLLLYVLWQHGVKCAGWATLAGGMTVIVGHALFWPGIVGMWVHLPKKLTPFLDGWRLPKDAGIRGSAWEPEILISSRVVSFFEALRYHFVAFFGVIASLLLWPKEDSWKRKSEFRSAVFLLLLFVIGALLHGWASLLDDYCVFCFSSYLAFFSPVGLLLVLLTISIWRRELPLWWQIGIVFVVLFLSAGIGYGIFEIVGNSLYDFGIPGFLVNSASPGLVSLGAVWQNLTGLDKAILRRLLPTAFGLVVGLTLLVLSFIFRFVLKRYRVRLGLKIVPSVGYILVVSFLILGTLLSPTVIMRGIYNNVCSKDTIESYEAVGSELSQAISPGSLVYWAGGESAAPLLYLPDVDTFPPQVNDGYSYYIGGDPDTLLRYNRWNNVLARRWVREADYVLIEGASRAAWLWELLLTDHFEQVAVTSPKVHCIEDSRIWVFQRVK